MLATKSWRVRDTWRRCSGRPCLSSEQTHISWSFFSLFDTKFVCNLVSKHKDFSRSLLSSFHLPPPLLPPNSPFLGWPLCCVQTLLKTFLPLGGGVGTGVSWVYLTQKCRLSSQRGSELFPWSHTFSFPARNPFNMHSFQWGCKTQLQI